MILVRGWKLSTIEAYEKKQNDLAKEKGVKRYAGRKGKPDIILQDGSFFIPDENGDVEVEIVQKDIL